MLPLWPWVLPFFNIIIIIDEMTFCSNEHYTINAANWVELVFKPEYSLKSRLMDQNDEDGDDRQSG